MKQGKTAQVLFSILLLTGLVFGMVQPATVTAQTNEPQAPGINVDPLVLEQIAADGAASYWVDLSGKSDLSPAQNLDWSKRGWYVYEQLSKAAAASQANVAAYLKESGVKFKSFWIKNTILVESSNLSVLNGLMRFSEIEAIRAHKEYIVYEPDKSQAVLDNGVNAVEPNLVHINADDAWALGYVGEGVVVANIDTGVRYTHQALVNQYRGNTGGGAFAHDYNWYDPYGDYTAPADANGHGTHTMGTMVGDDGGANQIGIAPGAEWMACRGCDTSSCSDTALLTCAEFIAAPTDVSGNNPDPDMRPDAVNNSWGDCGLAYDGWYQTVVDAWQAAGVYPIFSNGNASNCGYSSPPGLGTVGNPARYGNVTGVGSSGEQNGQYASHSNWGPSDVADPINAVAGFEYMKPQVIAPGVSIRSSTPGSDNEYQDGWSGTSMSAPHVTGLVALMWQAGPCLVGDYATTETLMENTAVPVVYDDGSGDTPTNDPNYAAGWGEIDALAAVQAAASICGDSTLDGTVTDAVTAEPLEGAKVTITAYGDPANNRTVYTNADGYYTASVWADTYDITAEMFGYTPETVTGVVLASGGTATTNFALDELGTTMVTGFVYDGGIEGGASHGYPLYASLTFSTTGFNQTIYTDPFTGAYEIELYFGQEYNVIVAAVPSGYEPFGGTFTPDAAPDTQDYTLYINAAACAAPGYQPDYDLYWNFESDAGGFTPGGTTSFAWGDFISGPGAGHSGTKGLATNPAGDYNANELGYIASPAIDLTGFGTDAPVLEWWDWKDIESVTYDWARLDVTKDGGATWMPVWGPVGGVSDTAYNKQTVVLDPTYNVANFQFRFYFKSDSSVQYAGWYVDDVGIAKVTTPPPTMVWSSNFDANNGGFTASGANATWAWGAPTSGPGAAHSAPNVWATNLSGDYNASEESYITSPLIDLSTHAGLAPTVSFWHWMDSESNTWDWGALQVSNNGGSSWTTVYEKFSDVLEWTYKSVQLDPSYAVSNFQFRFNMHSDSSVQYTGWYIDDVAVTVAEEVTLAVPCVAKPGGVVAGYVFDGNNMAALNDATVTSDTGVVATTFANPADPIEGFYWLFQPLGTLGTTGVSSGWTPAAVSGGSPNAAITTRSSATGPAAPVSAPAPQADVLWNQPLSSVNQAAYVDQEFPDYPTFSSFLADDFSNTEAWEISTIFVPGDMWNGATTLLNASALNFMIFADDGGVPAGDPSGGGDAPLWALSVPPTDPQISLSTGTPGGYLSNTTLNLAAPVQLPAGHYWLVFYPTMSFGSYGQFGRQPADTTNGYGGQFINPGGGFGSGTAWQSWAVIAVPQQDSAFRLEGSVIVLEEEHDFTAAKVDYGDDTQTVLVIGNAVTQQDFVLGAGNLAFDPTALEKTMTMGDAPEDEMLTISNNGTRVANFEISERNRGFTPLSIPAFNGALPESNVPTSMGRAPNAPAMSFGSAGAFNELFAGEPAFAVDVYPGENVVSIPDTTAPGTWDVVGPVAGTTFFAGDFLNGDFSTLYVVDSDFSNLYAVDTATAGVTLIGATTPPGGETFTGLTGGPGGDLYGLTSSCAGSSLVMVDPATGATTVLGALPGVDCGIDLAYSTVDDMIYIVDIVSDNLMKVDPVTLNVTTVGALGVSANYAQGMDFEEDTGILYWAAYTTQGELRVIDTTTGASALVGAFPGGAEVDSFAFATGGVTDVPWLSEDPVMGAIDGGEDLDVTVTFDPRSLGQPGDYMAELKVSHDTPYTYPNIPVTLHLLRPDEWGTFNGTVNGMERCDVNLAALEDATVNFYQAAALVASTTTDANGYYTWSLEEGTYDIEVLADGFVSQMVYDYPVDGGETVTVNFDLRLDAPCLVVDPTSLEQSLLVDTTAQQTLTINNIGAAAADFELMELEAEAPTSIMADVEMILDDGGNEDAIGIGGTWEFIFLNRFTPSPDAFPFNLDEIQVYFEGGTTGTAVGDDIVLVVYENTSGNADPAVGASFLASFPVTVQAVDAWNYYSLPSSVSLNGPGDVLLGVIAMETPGTSYFPAAIDQTVSQERSWAGWWLETPPPDGAPLPPDDTWGLIDDFGFAGNWMIRGMGSSAAVDILWLDEDPTAGSIPADSSVDITVTFDATGLALGDYYATLRVGNSPDPAIPVPVVLHVVDNTPPVAVNDAYVVNENSVLNVDAAAGVLDNDTDADADPLVAQLVTGPANGELVLNADGSFTYTPDADFFGEDTFTYQAFDGFEASAPATVTITVNEVFNVLYLPFVYNNH